MRSGVMGKNRTQERKKIKQKERAEKRTFFEEKRASGLAECLARKAAIRKAYEKENPGKQEFTLYFRRNKLMTLDFSGIPVPYGNDPDHPEKGITERTREMVIAFEESAKEPC